MCSNFASLRPIYAPPPPRYHFIIFLPQKRYYPGIFAVFLAKSFTLAFVERRAEQHVGGGLRRLSGKQQEHTLFNDLRRKLGSKKIKRTSSGTGISLNISDLV